MKRHLQLERWEEREYEAEQADLWNAISRDIAAKAVAKQAPPYRDLTHIDGGLLGPGVDDRRAIDEDIRRLTETDGGW